MRRQREADDDFEIVARNTRIDPRNDDLPNLFFGEFDPVRFVERHRRHELGLLDHFEIGAGDGDEIGELMAFRFALRAPAESKLDLGARLDRLVAEIAAIELNIVNFRRIGDVFEACLSVSRQLGGAACWACVLRGVRR